jgi:hypothetical protein
MTHPYLLKKADNNNIVLTAFAKFLLKLNQNQIMDIRLLMIVPFIGIIASVTTNPTKEHPGIISDNANLISDTLINDPIDTVQDISALQSYAGDAKMLVVTDLIRGGLFYKTNTGVIDDGTVIAGASGYWNRQYQKGVVHVGWFGGKTDVQIQNAINVADTGGIVYLQPKSRYIIYGSLFPRNGQRIIGMYDTLQRCNEVKAVLQTAIPSGGGTRTFNVNNADNFIVGMVVNFYSATNITGSTTVHRITDITGNSITTDAGLSYQAYAVGDTVITEFAMISNPFGGGLYLRNVAIENIVFDGNKTNNSSHPYWAFNAAVTLYCDNLKVSDCYFINSKADGLIMGGDNPIVTHCQFLNGNSNGVHLSGSYNPGIFNNYFYNNNLNMATGHNEGHITFSDSIFHANIYANYFKKTALSGVGRVGGSVNGSSNNVSIHDNVFDSCLFASVNIGNAAVVSPNIYNFTISNNRIYNCGRLGVSGINGTLDRTKGPGRVNISGNLFINSPVGITRSNNINFSGNTLYKDVAAASPAAYVFLIDNENISITGNHFMGNMSYALQCDNTATTAGIYKDKGYLISDNSFIDQTVRAISFVSKNSGVYEDVKISNNNFRNSVSSNAIVSIGSGIEFSFNTMSITGSATKCAIACQFSGTSVLDSAKDIIIKNNYIKVNKGYAIRIGRGTGVKVIENQYATSDLTLPSPIMDSSVGAYFAYNKIIDSAYTGVGVAKPLAAWHTIGSVRTDLGDDAKYDTHYRDSITGNLVRLPAGTYGQVYTAGPGGKPYWSAPAPLTFALQTVTDNTMLTVSNYTTVVNNTGTVTIALPAAASVNGKIYVIKKVSTVPNDVVIDGNDSELIDGALTQTLTLQYSSITIQSNGSGWVILGAVAGGTSL